MRVSECNWRRLGLLWLLVAVLAVPAVSLASMPRVFGDDMVLQQGKPIPVWGQGQAGEQITVSMAGKSATGKADAAGKWMVRLPAMTAGGPFMLTVKGNKSTVRFKNVLVGEVWVCSGQSNMGFAVKSAINAEQEIAAANYPKIRLITVNRKVSPSPLEDVETDGWKVCTPETVPGFSAVAYFFGRDLHRELNVPVGLINTSWGGTAIEPWTPPVGFVLTPEVSRYFDEELQADREYAKRIEDYVAKRQDWAKAVKEAAGRNDAELPSLPLPPVHPFVNGNTYPSVIYNAMVHGIVPFGMAGAIWYQGENNCVRGDGLTYLDKMKALVGGWRAIWGEGDFPFYYVQIAPWQYHKKYPGALDRLPLIWEAQRKSLVIPNTGMAVTADIGNTTNIHPKNKQEVGRRLALWALAKTYGHKGLVYSGPLYKSMQVDGDKILISFDYTGSGLASRDGKPLSWFAVAGADKKFAAATATIEGDTIVVSSPEVGKPVAVRFGWDELAEPNLMNKEVLPASPFRTDDWTQVPSTQPQ